MPAPSASPITSSSASAPVPRAKPTASVAVVPPPPGMARGRYEVSSFTVGIAAVALSALVAGFFFLRHRRNQKNSGYESVAPSSGSASSRRNRR